MPELHEDEKKIIEQSTLPLSQEIIIDYLSRYLATSKWMNTDVDSQALRFRDDADLLFGYPEYAIALGIIKIIEFDKGTWYPPFSVLKESVEENLIFFPSENQKEGVE